jgi:3-phenylpropionate/trans-cinnamate dioxygenase ferredoxin subunit
VERGLTPVGDVGRFPPRSVTVVRAGDVELGIVRWDGEELYALRNVCPHAGGPVCAGRLGPRIVSEAGDPLRLAVDDACPTLTCAWHGWEFDARDGRALAPGSRLRVRTYPVRIESGTVLVDLGVTRR